MGSLFAASAAHAQISVVAEAPGSVASSATFTSHTIVDFDTATLGNNGGVSLGALGDISGGRVVTHDQYGGAPSYDSGTSTWSRTGQYITTGSPASPVTITLNTPQNYFGLWLSAINAGNIVQIYSGTTLLRSFNSTELNTLLADTQYRGSGALASEGGGFNAGENFAFVNFYGLSTTTFDRIVLSGSGFESDNYTIGMYSAQGSGVGLSLPDIVAAGNSNGTNLASSISNGFSSNFNNRFDGGTLLVDVANTYGGNFSITANGATIDQNGLDSVFTGVFSDDSAGTPGNLTITNSGTGGSVTLTNTNTYTGTTTIDSGATLALSGNNASIASSSAVINNGTFDLTHANPTGTALGGSYTQGASGNLRLGATAPNTFQLLSITGSASLNGTLTLNAAPGNYTMGRYTLISATGGVSGTFSDFSTNLASVAHLGYRLGYSGNEVYLFLTASTDDTLQEMRRNAQGLRSVFNGQNGALLAGLSYDCTIFDKNNVCVSSGGRYTFAGDGSTWNLGGLLILAYRPTEKTRIGVFADQSLDAGSPGTFTVGKNDPTLGVFGNWAMNKDGNGLNLHASAVFSSADLTVTRPGTSTTEGGQGRTALYGQAYELRATYVKPLNDDLTVSPYIGLRYSRIGSGAYSEYASAQVANPVSYNAVAQDVFSAIVGSSASLRLKNNSRLTAGVGLQQNLGYKMDAYSGSSDLAGMTTFSVPTDGHNDTLLMASLGAHHDLNRRERLAINALWQEQPNSHKGTTSIIATWTMGF